MGQKNKVHLSKETAHLLQEAGKGTWVSKREDKVMAKGMIPKLEIGLTHKQC
jgi:hypothetical protein